MSDLPEGNDPAGRRPERPAPSYGDDRYEVIGHDPRLAPHGRYGRRVRGRNEIRWAIGYDGRKLGTIVAHLEEVHEPRPVAGTAAGPDAGTAGYRPGVPLGPDGRPRGSRLFDEGIRDAFPDEAQVDWLAWAAVENALLAELRRGNQVTLTSRAVPDPASRQPVLAVAIQVVDPRSGQAVQYKFATLAEHAAINNWGPARTPPLTHRFPGPQPAHPVPPQQSITEHPTQPQPQPGPAQGAGPIWWTTPAPDPRQGLPAQTGPGTFAQPGQYPPPPPVGQTGPTVPVQPGQTGPTTPTQPGQYPPPPVGPPQQPGGQFGPPPVPGGPYVPAAPGGQFGPPAVMPGGPNGPPWPGQVGLPVPGVGYAWRGQVGQYGPAPDPAAVQRAAYARAVLGTAFGVVAPGALPLQDGSIRLGEDGDVVDRMTVERMSAQLARRAEEQASGPRMLAEAVAMLGDHAARINGESPADGATQALDLLLDVPFLPERNRVEAQAVLQRVLDSTSEPAPTGDRPPRMSTVVAAAEEISRDARVLDATNRTAPVAVPGRHRRAVGGRHSRTDRTVGVPRIEGAARSRGEPDLGIGEALDAAGQVRAADLGGAIRSDPVRQGATAVVDTEDFGQQHFRVELGRPGWRRAAAVDVRSGTSADPHVLRVPPKVARNQLGRVWAHAIGHTLQEKSAIRAGGSGFVARVRDTVSGASRDRCLTAQYDEFRLLARNWQENRDDYARFGMAASAQRMRDIGLNIQGLSAAIARRGQAAPIPPWAAGPVSVNAVPTPTSHPTGASLSAVTRLRHRVAAEADRLDAAATYLRTCADTKEATAAEAGRVAEARGTESRTEGAMLDSGAAERARLLMVEADQAAATQIRHTTISTTYAAAADHATEARDAYRTLLGELDATAADPNRSLAQVQALAAEAQGKVVACRERFEAALPSDFALPSGVSVGRLPHLNALTRHLNEGLKARKVGFAFTPEHQHLLLRSELGQVLGDGLVVPAGPTGSDAAKQAQVMIRLKVPDRYDATDGTPTHSEMIVGQLDQRNHTVSTTVTRSRQVKGKYGLRGILSAIPGSGAVRAAAEAISLVAPRVELAAKRANSMTTVSAANGRRGAVEDIRGEAVASRSDAPVWEVRFRTSPFEPWSDVSTVDTSGPDDSQSMTMRFSHSYTVPPPQAVTDIVKEGVPQQRRTTMPEHVASHVGRMNEICDEAAVKFRAMFGDVDSVAYGQLRSLANEWPGRLDEANAPGGFARTIVNNGRAVAWVQAETKLVWDSVEPAGGSSDAHWDERVRVSIATTGVAQTVATTSDKALAAGYDFDGLGPTDATIGPAGAAARSRSGDEGMSTTATKYEVGVERVKRTQAYKARLVHMLTVHKLGSQESFQVGREGDALLRMAESDAFRYGLPVAYEAVKRDADGKARFHPDGRILLRGDPQPVGPEVVRPGWMGTGERQMRGKGPGQVPLVTGIDEVAVLRGLEAEGLVPPLDDRLQPKLAELPGDYDRELLTCQLDNLERARQGISGMRAGTSYDQATQGGVTVPLELRRSGVRHAPERFVLDLSLRQRFETASVIGVSDAEQPLFLDIESITSAQTGNRATTTKGSGSAGIQGGSALPQIGPTGNLQVGSNRGQAAGVTSNRVGLRESRALGVAIAVPHTSSVLLRSRDGVKPLASSSGHAVLMLEGEQCRPAAQQPFWSIRGEAVPDVLDRFRALHLDGGDALQKLWAAMPPATRADPAAYHQLAAFCDVRKLVADPEWTRKAHRTRIVSPVAGTPALAARQLSLTPSDVTVEMRARVVDLEHLGAANPISGRINLTLNSEGTTTGTSRGGGFGFSAGPGAADPGAGASAGASVEAGRGVVNSESRTRMEIGGDEGLGVDLGVHDDFRARIVWEAVVTRKGHQPQVVPVGDGAGLYSIPERQLLDLYGDRKLDLPVERTADTVERYLSGKLELDRRTAAKVIRRYREDKAGVTQGLAALHTDERLAAALRSTAGIPAPVVAGQAGQDLDSALAQTTSLGQQRVAVPMPEHYETTMAEGLVDAYSMADWQTGRKADVLPEVMALIERQSPGLLGSDGTLADSLSGELEGDRWLGHRIDMWSPRGWVREYSVKTSELGPPERVRLRIRGRFAGPITTDGTPRPAAQQAMNILQAYLYMSQSQSRTRAVNYTGSLDLTGAGGFGVDDPTVGVASHRLHSVSAANSQTMTWMSRIAHPETAQVERGFYLVVDVERFPAPGTAKDRLQRAADRPAAVAPVGTVLAGEMKMLVPRDYVGMASPAAVPATQRLADHRTAAMPENPYYVGSMRPYLSGEQETDHLFNALYHRLGQSDLLTNAGLAAHRTTLETKTSMARMQAAFKLLMSQDGYRIDDLDVPGQRRRVSARITGKVFDMDQIAGPVGWVELGEVMRNEVVTQTSLGGNRMQPVSRTVGTGNEAAGIGVSVTTGEQVTDKVTDLSGSRGERSMFTRPERAVVVRLRYSCDIEYERTGRLPGSKPRLVDTQRNAAVGEAFVTMAEKDFHAMRAQMEAGTAIAPPPTAQRLAVRRVLADEYAIGRTGPEYHPYRPLVSALQQARHEGAVVALTVRQHDGSMASYQATPDGSLSGENDGGFGAAFGTLHPNLALLSEGRVDLRGLYRSPRGEETFTRSVSKALEQAGVPPAIVAEAAHSVDTQAAARHAVSSGQSEEGSRPHISSTYSPGPTAGMSV